MLFLSYIFIILKVILAQGAPEATVKPTNEDYQKLKVSLQDFMYSNSQGVTRTVPLLVRLSFHDLANMDRTNGMGSTGCIQKKSIQEFKGNEGLTDIVNQLTARVVRDFPTIAFPFGDVVSMAGKVAVETAYPCLQIPWEFGRGLCNEKNPGEVPEGDLDTAIGFDPFLRRYNITPTEMGILFAGGHGINGARATVTNSKFGTGIFANTNDGKDWIVQTLRPGFTKSNSTANKVQYKRAGLLRMPTDMFWFPDAYKAAGGVADPNIKNLTIKLTEFTTQDRNIFDQEFGKAYAKMLRVGALNVTLTPFEEIDGPTAISCTGSFAPRPQPPVNANNNIANNATVNATNNSTVNTSNNSTTTTPANSNSVQNTSPLPPQNTTVAPPKSGSTAQNQTIEEELLAFLRDQLQKNNAATSSTTSTGNAATQNAATTGNAATQNAAIQNAATQNAATQNAATQNAASPARNSTTNGSSASNGATARVSENRVMSNSSTSATITSTTTTETSTTDTSTSTTTTTTTSTSSLIEIQSLTSSAPSEATLSNPSSKIEKSCKNGRSPDGQVCDVSSSIRAASCMLPFIISLYFSAL